LVSFSLCRRVFQGKSIQVSLYSLIPYLIIDHNSKHSSDNNGGITVDLTNIIFESFFGANIKIQIEKQWLDFNGSRVIGGTLGKV